MNNYEKNDIEKFRLIVDQLEICKNLMKDSNVNVARIAIILLDNLADTLMYRFCLEQFRSDEELIMLMRPRFTPEERRNALRYFEPKLNILKREKILDDRDIIVLRIIHSYRNAAYHRDTHNPQVVKVLAKILFRVMCNLFLKLNSAGCVIGGFTEPQNWLKAYGLEDDVLDFKKASRVIVKKLTDDVRIAFLQIKKAFVLDIRLRLKEIEELRQKIPYCNRDDLFDCALKWFEFRDNESWSEYYKDYLGLRYRITSNGGNKPTLKEIKNTKTKCDKKFLKDLDNFNQSISCRTITKIKKVAGEFRSIKSMEKLLQRYQEIDFNLSKVEFYLDQIDEDWDREVQRAIDTARGK